MTTFTVQRPSVGAALLRWGRGLREAPVAVGFAGLLGLTTIALKITDQDEAILRWASTNLDNLTSSPLRAFVASAGFLPGEKWWPYAIAIALTLVPLERRFGGVTAVGVFASGHVVATLVTEGWVWLGIRHGVLPGTEAAQLDVGISYGIYAAAGAAMVLLPRRRRAVVLAALGGWLLYQLARELDMTATGHVLSLAIGLAWWPVLRSRRAAASSVVSSSAASAP